MMNCQGMMCGKCCPVHKISAILVFVGALNWGLIGLFNLNLVMTLFGSWPMVERIVYILVGVSAILMLFAGKCKMCHMDGKKM